MKTRFVSLFSCLCVLAVAAQDAAPKKSVFSWVTPAPDQRLKSLPDGLTHATFESPSMGIEVGYYIYLPPGYEDAARAETRYPVVYHLHGGRPGAEGKSLNLARFVHVAILTGVIEPTIYVFPNGGPMSWYNYPEKENAMGEDVFVQETIPHVDATWRTIASREGRALEGFSQGGRGTTRIMFKHPELFVSCAPGGSGYGNEKRVWENDGWESENVRFLPVGYDTWSLAKAYAKHEDSAPLNILIWFGTEDFNYESNLAYMDYLKGLEIPFESVITKHAPHSAVANYEAHGAEIMGFHQKHFEGGRQ